jgi:hypothetical protein
MSSFFTFHSYIFTTFNNQFSQMFWNNRMFVSTYSWSASEWRHNWIVIRKESCCAYHFKNISVCFMDLPFMLWHPKVTVMLLGLYIKTTSAICLWSHNGCRRGTAEIMLHGYMPTPATMLKLRVPCFNYVFTVVVKENMERKHQF